MPALVVLRQPLILCLFLCFAGPAQAAGLADTLEHLRPSVVAVGTAYPLRQPIGGRPPNAVLASGFAVHDGRYVITNDHVIPEKLDTDNRQQLVVFSGRGKDAVVRVVKPRLRDPDHDLALLEIAGEPLVPLALGDDTAVREGEDVAFTGFPIGAVLGLFPATHRGIVAAITPMARAAGNSRELTPVQLARLRDPFEVFQLDAIAYPGNSGSAVYRPSTGEVIGVINSVFVKESRESLLERPSGISYAIPVRHVKALLAQLPPRN